MEIFPRYWPFVRAIRRLPVNSPHKGQWRGALMFYLIFAWKNGWVNNREAGDLRRHHAHYNIIAMDNTVLQSQQHPRGHDDNAMITSLLRQNDVAKSFWRNNNVIFALCVRSGGNMMKPLPYQYTRNASVNWTPLSDFLNLYKTPLSTFLFE